MRCQDGGEVRLAPSHLSFVGQMVICWLQCNLPTSPISTAITVVWWDTGGLCGGGKRQKKRLDSAGFDPKTRLLLPLTCSQAWDSLQIPLWLFAFRVSQNAGVPLRMVGSTGHVRSYCSFPDYTESQPQYATLHPPRWKCWVSQTGYKAVKTLCYKPEGRGFETRLGELFFFSIYLIFPAALGPAVYSASNINEY
jgi:hypothetical protein